MANKSEQFLTINVGSIQRRLEIKYSRVAALHKTNAVVLKRKILHKGKNVKSKGSGRDCLRSSTHYTHP